MCNVNFHGFTFVTHRELFTLVTNDNCLLMSCLGNKNEKRKNGDKH